MYMIVMCRTVQWHVCQSTHIAINLLRLNVIPVSLEGKEKSRSICRGVVQRCSMLNDFLRL